MTLLPGPHPLRRILPVVIACAMVALMITGVIRNYSPVPFWDMWDGYIGFYLRLIKGDMWAWLDFQNEHRIVLTRLLFFADLAWAQGRGWIPLAANIILAALAIVCLCAGMRRLTPAWAERDRLPWYALVTGMLTFWSQAQNFTWAFQPQFFLAFLLPLACCFYAADAASRKNTWRSFAFACIAGLLSLGSMANGVLALPLLAALTVFFGMGRRRIALAIILAAFGIATARWGYHATVASDPAHLPWNQPFSVARYTLLYLGSPVGNVLPVTRTTLVLSALTGIISVCSTLIAGIRGWHARHAEPMRIALAVFSVYVCASALATALGRVDLGPVSAFSGRYTTPALMALAANAIALLPSRPLSRMAAWIPAVLLMIMLPAQFRASASAGAVNDGRMLAALSLELQANDPSVLQTVYPRSDTVLSTARAARDAGISVFTLPPIAGAATLIGQHVDAGTCTPVTIETKDIADSRYVRFTASLRPPPDASHGLSLLDDHSAIIGVALPVRSPDDIQGKGANLTGYALRDAPLHHPGLTVCVIPRSN